MLPKGKMGLAVFFSQKTVSASVGHLLTHLSSPGPSALGLARGAPLDATAGALCSQGAQPASGTQAGTALTVRPTEAALFKKAPA